MRREHIKLKDIVAAFALALLLVPPLAAQEAAPDGTDEAALLERLAEAEGAEADRIDRQLRAIWNRSGSPAMDLLMRRAQEAMEEGALPLAVDHLTALSDHAPGFAEAWHLRASAFFQMERYGLALEDLRRALALNPNNYHAIHGLGATFEALGEYDLAYRAYSRALAIHPGLEDLDQALERLQAEVEGTEL